ncbi:LiaRS two-component regulatory system accessory protein LiaF [Bacillus vallismortis]|uniref:LiaRS two-component regulatory system accessory protein LiaF n=1 Tax=Bacillus vallismortis TaxID=72361 RepID=A0AAP3FUY6_BACVA|nr:LiaRS two-component regulatory system accessory protein LiaF [Bacillus vallismortis]MCY7917492.1 LiaRS two-component regulatory system accessory protein LiaF [Bacillus vallismortis]MCY8309362.1 LiaRS two-component regulatory system accessory protein LiaF [Bacillus vallismortis]MCY8316655.1 LiaRS two-component regulatory system accessory protein LiaF [Bacillus vallismortis]MCY8596965.1 LiaRS two-component regulatory system accessory protein LiaF [Bacillus vallismortis]MEC1791262.1 LiaRS two-
MTKKQLLGLIIALFGISMFLQIIGIGDLLFWPLFFLIAGYFLKKYSRDWLGSVMYIFAAFLFLKNLFSITFNLFGYAFAAFLIYAGYRLIKGKPIFEPSEKRVDLTKKERHEPPKDEKHPDIRSFFIGELQMMKQPFDLNDLNISGFIGDIKIDLSKAMIPEGESTIVISGVIGNVDVYVPSDLEVAVSSAVFIGDINLIGSKKSGLSTKVYAVSPDFSESKRRVKVSVSLFIGDVDVKYV